MPYKSESQRRFFHVAEERGDIPKKVVKEYDEESKGKDLPEFVDAIKEQKKKELRKKMWQGGVVEEQNPDLSSEPLDSPKKPEDVLGHIDLKVEDSEFESNDQKDEREDETEKKFKFIESLIKSRRGY